MWCQGNIESCDADEKLCACGVMRCLVHGHVDEGDDPRCRYRLDAIDDESDGRGYDELDLSRWEDD
jgi:hypothetical protein